MAFFMRPPRFLAHAIAGRSRMEALAAPIGLYISLNQCSLSSGLKYRSNKRDRLASDEPNVLLISPT